MQITAPSLVIVVHRILQVHSFQHCAHPRKQKVVYNKPTTKQKSKNKENLSGYHTGDESNIAGGGGLALSLMQSRTGCGGRTTLHIKLMH